MMFLLNSFALILFFILYFNAGYLSFNWLNNVFKLSDGFSVDLSKIRIENPEFIKLEHRLVKAAAVLIFYVLFLINGFMIYLLLT